MQEKQVTFKCPICLQFHYGHEESSVYGLNVVCGFCEIKLPELVTMWRAGFLIGRANGGEEKQ